MHSRVPSEEILAEPSHYHVECDSFRSWIICLVNFTTGFVSFGIHCNFGLMHRHLGTQFQNGNALTGEWTPFHFIYD